MVAKEKEILVRTLKDLEFSSDSVSLIRLWKTGHMLSAFAYHIYPKYLDTLSTYHTCPKI